MQVRRWEGEKVEVEVEVEVEANNMCFERKSIEF